MLVPTIKKTINAHQGIYSKCNNKAFDMFGSQLHEFFTTFDSVKDHHSIL